MTHECKQEKIFDIVIKKLDKLEEKVDTILHWKWSIIGCVTAIGAIITLLANIIF